MKFSHALLLASSLAFFACGDEEDSPAGPSTPTTDCSVSGGIKIVSPAGGEKFKVGEEITVVFGTDVVDGSQRILFKNGADDPGEDLGDDSFDAVMDGKTCNEYKIKLDADKVEATKNGIIRVMPYGHQNKFKDSKTFTVSE